MDTVYPQVGNCALKICRNIQVGGKEPKTQRVPSENIRINANVASTWSKWSRLYSFLIIVISTIAPARAAADKAATNARMNEPVALATGGCECSDHIERTMG